MKRFLNQLSSRVLFLFNIDEIWSNCTLKGINHMLQLNKILSSRLHITTTSKGIREARVEGRDFGGSNRDRNRKGPVFTVFLFMHSNFIVVQRC